MMLEICRRVLRPVEVTVSCGEVNDGIGEMSHKRPHLRHHTDYLQNAPYAPPATSKGHIKNYVS
jgi:hypothetical protein